MTKINVIDNCNEENLGGQSADDVWSRDSTSQSHSISGIEIVGTGYCEFETCFDIPKNSKDTYYLVYVNYDTGDSFGRDEGRISFVDLFKTEEKAEQCAKALRTHYDNHASMKWDDQFSISLTNENNTTYKYFASWIGYFEHLNFIEVKPVQVTKSRRY